MYNHIQGKLTEKSPTHVVIESAGIGYFINISLQTFSKIGDNEPCKLFLHLAVKEDAHVLYGFADENERRIFKLLISVSGIGETTARMMLSSLSPDDIQNAITTGNANLLQGVKGIGAKTAQRAIIDLQDKFRKGENTGIPMELGTSYANPAKEQAIAALLTLGFGKQAVEKSVNQIIQQKPGSGVEEVIRLALNSL